ncbi:MAG: 2-dehydropantoate 2-reductase N-terminal domain-containing protein, partial [Gemmataceae bacterium]
MRILIVGAGATGGFFGGRLTEAGRDVTFLVRGQRADQLRRNGLQIHSPLGDATVQPKLTVAEDLRASNQPFDLVIVATKAYSLEAALDDFAPAVGPETTILPILNGLRQLDILDARFGTERVLGGSCRVVGDVDSEGRVVQMSKLGEITFGERSREHTPRIERIAAALR